eukprot:4488055-Alexandrium_andersonii.AAC.1
MAQASPEDLEELHKQLKTLQSCKSVLSVQGCSQGAAMINMAVEQVKHTLNVSKPPAESIAHFSNMVECTEAQLLQIEEQIADLSTKR